MGAEAMTRRRTVLMTADPIGGVWTYALDLADALAPLGVRVLLATMGGPLTHEQRDAAHMRPHVRLFESRYALEWMDDPWGDVDRAGDWLQSIAREEGADLVHLNGYSHAALPWSAPVLVVAHSCVCSWWRAVRGDRAPASWDEYRRRVAAGLRAADALVAPTRAMLDALPCEYGASVPATAQVVPNGRAPSGVAGAKRPFVLGAGRLWDEAKNLASLARVAPAVPWPVFIAGDTHPPRGTGGDVFDTSEAHLLGRITPAMVSAWRGMASIYALPARYEPFGLSVLEAALAECALVLGDLASLRETWGEAALYVPADDGDALADAIRHLAEHDAERRRLAHRAHERARRLTPRAMADAYLAIYASLLGGTRVPTPTEEGVACAS
jgi:glycosyltransferase involved in cell wall biosynthesis